MSQKPRNPSHSRRSGHVPGVSVTIKTAKAPHEQPVNHPTPPQPPDPLQHRGQQPGHGAGSALPPHVGQQAATRDVGDFAPVMAGVGIGGLVDVSTGPLNLLVNGSFENDLASPPSDWVLSGQTSTLTATLIGGGSGATDGQNYGRWVLTPGGTGIYTATTGRVPLDPSIATVVTASIDAHITALCTGGTGIGGHVGITFYDINTSVISSVTSTDIGQPTVGFFTNAVTAVVPSNCASAQLFFTVTQFGTIMSGTSDFHIDNAILAPVNFYSGYFQGQGLTVGGPDRSNNLATTQYVDNTVPAGIIAMYGNGSPPSGWMNCDGSAVSRSDFAALYAAIGVAFGAGDGLTTFNLPNLTALFPLGAGGGRAVGTTGGTTHTTHSHTLSGTGFAKITAVASGNIQMLRTTTAGWTGTIQATSTVTGNAAAETSGADLGGTTGSDDTPALQPFIALQYIIKF